jgi:membrane associated rhomboid family serine protease
MNTYLWILFTAGALGGVVYFACRIGIPTSRLVAAIAAAVVSFGIIGGLYAFKKYEARLAAGRSPPIDPTPMKPAGR